MKGDLYINNKDAYVTWGIYADADAMSVLMTPPPQKDRITNNSPLEHGVQYLRSLNKVDERTITLVIYLRADGLADFMAKYASFCEELRSNTLNIRTKWETGVEYKCLYVSCTQFSEYRFGLAKFSLRLVEPNPMDRILSTTTE